jgi:hypothetical protein
VSVDRILTSVGLRFPAAFIDVERDETDETEIRVFAPEDTSSQEGEDEVWRFSITYAG